MDVREAFLTYFESKQHERVESAPLVPDDPSLLFNNAGMVPFKKIFTGDVPVPQNPRAVSCQTCIRAGGKHNDLENVGHTARHHTFFEMLGNFSFGDYFKKEAIAYGWEFVTTVLEFPKEKLWVTVHESDDEAFELWQAHVDASRIKRFGDKDNFWQMGDTGPCGPCSEIFYDQGEEKFNGEEDYLGGEGDRFLEIWNLVFMQYEKDAKGDLSPLPKPSIDTGMGLERVVALKEGKASNYDSSLFMPIIEQVAKMIGKTYDYASGASYRVIADHIRTNVFLLAQGVMYGNEGRPYVLRRILRRAVRHGYLLGFREPFMYSLVDTVVNLTKSAYGYLVEKQESIKESIKLEEENFFKTIEAGIALFSDELKNTNEVFSGEVAFKLYDTYGFPLDLTQDMLSEKGLGLDIAAFEQKMKEQKERSKASWKGSGDAANEGDFRELLEAFGQNSFEGYNAIECRSKVLALLSEDFKKVDELHSEQQGWVLLDKTPFYAESGGQVGDGGELVGIAEVIDTRKFSGLSLSHIKVKKTLRCGNEVEAIVHIDRFEIAKHHSATHLLHAALYEILGEHISQAGSLVEAARLRFDFSHPKALTNEELKAVEEWVNHQIYLAHPMLTEVMDIESAKKSGAKAQFGEKYDAKVRVVSFGDASVELCGGTHVDSASTIGTFIITKESGVSAGVRRIEAVCGNAAYNYFKSQRHQLYAAQELVKNKDIVAGVEKLKSALSEIKKELSEAQNAVKEELQILEINGVTVVVDEIKSGDIKAKIDEIKNAHEKVATMLFQIKGDKVLMAAGVKNVSVKAGDWIKNIAPIVGGGGGGRPDFAQAGGKEPAKLDEALKAARTYVEGQL